MAKRLLLTLLALLAGLATQLTPAQARSNASVDMEIGASATIVALPRAMPSRSVPTGRHDRRAAFPAHRLRPAPSGGPAAVATVLPGIDRARE